MNDQEMSGVSCDGCGGPTRFLGKGLYECMTDCTAMEALLRFADDHGRTWNALLRGYWAHSHYPGVYESDIPHLQRIRNTKGPSWLFRLTAEQLRYTVERNRRRAALPAAPLKEVP